MSATHPGMAGALGGAMIGTAQYVIALAVMRRHVAREVEAGGDMPGMAFVAQRFVRIRRVLAAISFIFLPVAGFALGAALGAGPETSP